MAKVKLGDLTVDWSVNPRGKKNNAAVKEYTQSLEEYKEIADQDNESFDKWFSRDWEQRIECTKDKIVTKGSHTIEALRNIYGKDDEITVTYVKIEGKPAEGVDDARWLAAQSNRKGLDFGEGEKKAAIEAMLEQMQPTKTSEVEGKRPFLSERPLAAAVGCSRSMVNVTRNDWLVKKGFKEKEEKKKKPTAEETADRAEQLLQEFDEKKDKKEAKPKKVETDPAVLNQDAEDLDDLNDDDDAKPATDVHPLDEEHAQKHGAEVDVTDADEDYEDDEDEDEDESSDREEHVDEFQDVLDNMKIAMKGHDGKLINKLDGLIGDDDNGILKPLLMKDSEFEDREVNILIAGLAWFVETIADECE